MGENTKIEWAKHTVNLWWGCAKVHTGCKNCYAEYFSDVRYKNDLWGEKAGRKRIKSAFKTLDKLNRLAGEAGEKDTVFVGSMMDIFEDPKPLTEPTDQWQNTEQLRWELFGRIETGQYDNLIFLFLTKRPENIIKYIPGAWQISGRFNVWFGTSVSNQETVKYADVLSSELRGMSNLFLSVEPQVGPIDKIDLSGIGWLIQGGESGSKKRPFDIAWAYQMRSICESAGTPYFFKQIDKVKKIPKDLQIMNFPNFKTDTNELHSVHS